MASTTTRAPAGMTMVEMMVATVIMSIVSLAMLGLILLNNKANGKVGNIEESSSAVRIIKERLGKDIREGRNLGDVYGQSVYDTINNDWINVGSDTFPASNNPVYPSGQAPPNGWPGGAFGDPPYQLSSQTLVVQIPVTDVHNDAGTQHAINSAAECFPTCIQGPVGTSGQPGYIAAGQNVDNVETHVYRVVPDPANPGVAGDPRHPKEYLLQMCVFPGMAVTGTNSVVSPSYTFNYLPSAHNIGPVTLLSGIIGPLDDNANPMIFQYLNKTDPNGAPQNSITPTTTPSGQFVANYTGVVVNLELRKHQMTNESRTDISLAPIGFKTEVFLRNNAEATPSGQPQANW